MAGGVVLVASAVALGAWAVDAAADTTRVYVLSQDVAPGADLTADVVDAHPGTDVYVEVGHLPDGAVATRSMSKGELLATVAVDSGQERALRPVVLNVASSLPASTKVGDYVDLWLVPKASPAGRRFRRLRLRSPGRTAAAGRRRPRTAEPAAWPRGWSSAQSERPARD